MPYTTALLNMLRDEDGQGLVEYALIIVLIAVAIIGALGALGTTLSATFSEITSRLP